MVINNTIAFVKSKLLGEATGHDWWHCKRVWENAKLICSNESGVNTTVVELAALLHDISDWKFNGGDDSIGPRIAKEFLSTQNIADEDIVHVCNIIQNMSFKGAETTSIKLSKEGQIVQDADRLDALGAIGIARTFAYGAYRGQEIHNPDIKPETHQNYEDYKTAKGTTINHFYEKLLLLKDRMNTESAKEIALKRHTFMEQFLNHFYSEWDGKQ